MILFEFLSEFDPVSLAILGTIVISLIGAVILDWVRCRNQQASTTQ